MVKRIQGLSPAQFEEYIYSTYPVPHNAESPYKEWIDNLILKGSSYDTVYVYAQTVSNFLNYVKKNPRDISEADVKAYSKYLQSQGKSPKTVLSYLIRVGVFLKDIGLNINVYKFAPKEQVKVPEYLTAEEVEKFIKAIDESILDSDEPDPKLAVYRFRTLFTFLADTGLRATEVCNIEKVDIDFDERLVIVRQGKRGKYRQVPVSRKTLDMLKKYWSMRTDDLPYVFEYKGKKMDRLVIWRMTKQIAEKAGINKQTRTHGPSIHPHMFRHTFATLELKRLIRSGKGRMDALLLIKEALGHADIKTTMIYLTLLGEDIRDLMGR